MTAILSLDTLFVRPSRSAVFIIRVVEAPVWSCPSNASYGMQKKNNQIGHS
jgi:hypothetical protein